MRPLLPMLMAIAALAAGCGTTRWTDTARTATEQLLLSDAIDRAVSNFDLRALAGKQVYFDTTYLKATVDADYLVSSLCQHALASGCVLKTKAEEADYIVEIRSGGMGTDRHDLLFGVPSTNVPATAFTAGLPAQIPELPLLKRTEQRPVAKIALFAYSRQTSRPVWQSGAVPVESSAKAIWVLGAGPFRRGHIHQGTDFAGEKLNLPLVARGEEKETLPVAAEAYFSEPPRTAEVASRAPGASPLGQAVPPVAPNELGAPSPSAEPSRAQASPERADYPQSQSLAVPHGGPGAGLR